MYKVSVMYPNQPGSRFDLDYYVRHHMGNAAHDGLSPSGESNGQGVLEGQPDEGHCFRGLGLRLLDQIQSALQE
jgi:hypothetical protein